MDEIMAMLDALIEKAHDIEISDREQYLIDDKVRDFLAACGSDGLGGCLLCQH